MNIQSKLPTRPDEFLRWNEGREGKRDFVEGRIVDMMVKVSRRHALVASRVTILLGQSLPYPPFTVSTSGFGIKTATSVRYPDVMVDAERGSGSDLAAMAPVLVAEVLPPSTMATDLNEKALEYQSVPSLRHYLVLSQDESRIWLWTRGDSWSGPVVTEGLGSEIVLGSVNLTIRLLSIYDGLFDQL